MCIYREREQRLFLFSRMCCRCFYCVLLWDTVRCEKKHHVVEENRTSFWHSAHIFPYITTDPLRSACWINELELVQSICFNHQHKNAAHRQRAVYIIHFLSDVISQSVEINASDFFQLYLLRPVNFLLTINIYKCNTVFFQGLTDVIVFVSTAHATIIHFIHMLAISYTLTLCSLSLNLPTKRRVRKREQTKLWIHESANVWWSVTVRHSIRVYTALSKWNQIHRLYTHIRSLARSLCLCLCTEKTCAMWLPLRAFCGRLSRFHVLSISFILCLYIWTYWSIEGKSGKKCVYCELTHTVAANNHHQNAQSVVYRRIEFWLSLCIVAMMLTHIFFVPLLSRIIFCLACK